MRQCALRFTRAHLSIIGKRRKTMKIDGKKKGLLLAVSLVLVIGIFGVIAVTLTSTTGTDTQTEADAQTKADAQPKENGSGKKASSADIEAAENLVGESVSREEVQKALGEWEDFEMSSDGCERGVYAGRFYYGGFTLFSRTYDKGETFHIVSVNE